MSDVDEVPGEASESAPSREGAAAPPTIPASAAQAAIAAQTTPAASAPAPTRSPARRKWRTSSPDAIYAEVEEMMSEAAPYRGGERAKVEARAKLGIVKK